MKNIITYLSVVILSLITLTSYASCAYIEIPSSPFKVMSKLYSSNGFDTHEQTSDYKQCWYAEALPEVKILTVGFPQGVEHFVHGYILNTGMRTEPHGWIVATSKDIVKSGLNYRWNVEVVNYAENGDRKGWLLYHCSIHAVSGGYPRVTHYNTECV